MSESNRGQPSLPPCTPMDVLADGIEWDEPQQAVSATQASANPSQATITHLPQ
jgi:hypothetical protein